MLWSSFNLYNGYCHFTSYMALLWPLHAWNWPGSTVEMNRINDWRASTSHGLNQILIYHTFDSLWAVIFMWHWAPTGSINKSGTCTWKTSLTDKINYIYTGHNDWWQAEETIARCRTVSQCLFERATTDTISRTLTIYDTKQSWRATTDIKCNGCDI